MRPSPQARRARPTPSAAGCAGAARDRGDRIRRAGLLGVLDEGRLTDAKGRFCDFTNTIVLLTSNIGVKEAMAATDDLARRKDIILQVVLKYS